jgi:YidC/Oxa1 family membrane protein insertase
MHFLSDFMLEILRFFYVVGGHNYGLAVIWLTIAINLALYPLTLSSIQAMSAMQRIQPRLQDLQKKYKDEPQTMQKEMMELYRSEGVSPLGGCLPVLLKIPFFLALFFALQSKEFHALVSASGAGAAFLWVENLSKPEFLILYGLRIPTFAMLIGITTYFMQKTMPSVQQGQMQIMTLFMPVFIAFISINFPAGVQLYWLVSNLMGAVQQYFIMRKQPRRPKTGGKK